MSSCEINVRNILITYIFKVKVCDKLSGCSKTSLITYIQNPEREKESHKYFHLHFLIKAKRGAKLISGMESLNTRFSVSGATFAYADTSSI